MNSDRALEMVQGLVGHEMRVGRDLYHAALPFLNGLAEDVTWDASDCPDGGVYRGRVGVLDFFENYLSAWDWYCFNVLQAVDLDDHQVLVEAEEFGTHASGLDLRRRHWQVWTFEDGLVKRWAVYRLLDDAVASLDAEVPA
jgi:ketosteroid isomerase-like protein